MAPTWPLRTVQHLYRSHLRLEDNFICIDTLQMARTLLLQYSRSVRELALEPACLALLQAGAPLATARQESRAHTCAIAHQNDALGAGVTLVYRA